MAAAETRPGLLEGKNILVMGLISPDSFAWSIGERVEQERANVLYSAVNDRFVLMARRNFRNASVNLGNHKILECDVTSDESIEKFAIGLENTVDGLVYSIAFANPKTCLTSEIHQSPHADILEALDISAVGLAMVVGGLERAEKFNPNASIIAMTFDSQRTYADYGWMTVTKAALEAEVRCLAAVLGNRGIRANSLSAGPQETMAAARIPGFKDIGGIWAEVAPLGWNVKSDREAVADSAVYLLSDLSRKVTGHILYVDGGFHSVSIPVRKPEGIPLEETVIENLGQS